MNLKKILTGLDIKSSNKKQIPLTDIEDLVYDSRKARKGTLFIALKGETVDGHNFVMQAYNAGVRNFVLMEEVDLPYDTVQVFVDDTRVALSKISANFFAHPSRELKVIGITGTKGKTSVANQLKEVLCKQGINTGVIGTIGIAYNGDLYPTVNTTPESYVLQKYMRDMVDAGVECLAMEVSSGGIKMKRVNDVDFDIGVFTNLSPDHIGEKEHPTFEDYRYCKSQLFKMCKQGLFNIDDEQAEYMKKAAVCENFDFSIKSQADFYAQNIAKTKSVDKLGISYDFYKQNDFVQEVEIASIGEFNVYNSLMVLAICDLLGFLNEKTFEYISKVQVSGRAEVISVLPYATVILDYAHNGFSLENILKTITEYEHNRIICVFGSVGGRTYGRRKELAKVASKYADISVITSDNPDFEEPEKIIDEIASYFRDSACEILKISDRAEAIYKAMEMAKEGDVVLITGKGHEKYQLIKGERVSFDERAVVIKAGERVLSEK